MRFKVPILYTILCLIWGTTWIVLKMSLNEGTPPIFGVGLRFLVAGIVVWGIFFLRKESLPRDKIAIRLYGLFGLVNFGICYALTYWATQYVYSNVSSIIWAGFPFIVAMVANFFLPSEKITLNKLGSIFIGTIGVVLILTEGRNLGGDHVILGIVGLMIAVLLAAGPNVYLKKYHNTVNTIQLNAVSQTLAGLMLLIISAVVESDRSMVWSSFNLFAIAYLAIPGSVITWLIYIWLFSHMPVTQISYVAFFPPVIATLIGWIVLKEALTPIAVLGAVLVVLGALMINLLPPRGGNHV